MPAAEYDIFLSHAWKDGKHPQQIAHALTAAGLRLWFDATEIDDFAAITRAVTEGLAKSKALLAYYSVTYPLRRACQWELTAAFLAAQREGDPRRRVLVINPESAPDHIHPIELRDAKFRNAPNTNAEMQQLALRSRISRRNALWYESWSFQLPKSAFRGTIPAIREVFAMLRSHALSLLLGATLLCTVSVLAQRGHRNPPDVFKDEVTLPVAAHQGPDSKAMMQDAVELKQLSDGLPEEVQRTTQGTISADLCARLKRIEKLAKKLRGEVQQ